MEVHTSNDIIIILKAADIDGDSFLSTGFGAVAVGLNGRHGEWS
jgi:hypothetical protein